MKRITISLFTTILVCFSCQKDKIEATVSCNNQSNITVNSAHPKAAAITSLLTKYKAKGIPGMTVLISDNDGEYVESQGFADIKEGIKLAPCHINKLGSVTKMMMGVLAWQLVEEGTLDISKKLSFYLPDHAAEITNGDQITVEMLLNHSSGLYDVAGNLNFNLAVINDFPKHWEAEEMFQLLKNQEATSAPGEEIHYSNSNTLLLGMVIEKITGQSQITLLQDKISTPLSLNNTYYYSFEETFPVNYLAQGYLDFNNDGNSIQNISHLNPGSGNGFTGVYSNVGDMLTFMNALYRDSTLLSTSSLETISASKRAFEDGDGYSTVGAILIEKNAWLPEGIEAYGHIGGDLGYAANLNYFPHNNTVFAATFNYGTNLPTAIGDEVQNLRKELFALMAE